LVRVVAQPKGGDHTAETYEYDAAGRKKKTLYVDLATQSPQTLYGRRVDEAGGLLSRVEFSY
jgi:hypothetical protein